MSVLSLLQNLPALPPPPGVKSNFDNPETQDAALVKINAVFIAFMLLLIVIRIYSKAHITHTLWWDDYTCILAAIGSVIHTIMAILNLRLGYGRHLWDIRAITLTPNTVRQLSSISIIYPVVILLVKLSILLLYMRIFKVDRLFRQLIYFGILSQVLCYTAMLGVAIGTVASCSSAAALSNQLCKDSGVLVIAQGAVNVATDFYVLVLPIARVVRLQIPPRRKVGLCAIFLTGLAACIVSVARLVVAVMHVHDPDVFWNAALYSELTVIEMNVGISVACMTALPAFINESGIFKTATYSSLRSFIFSSCNRSKASKRNLTSDTPKTWQGSFADGNSSHRRLHDNNSFDLRDMGDRESCYRGPEFAHHPKHAKGTRVQTVDYTIV